MSSTVPSQPEYFRTPDELAAWFAANLRRIDELREAGRLRPGGERAVAARRVAERPRR